MLGLDSKALWVARCGHLVLQSLRSLAAGAPLPRLMSMDMDAEAEAVAHTAHVCKCRHTFSKVLSSVIY